MNHNSALKNEREMNDERKDTGMRCRRNRQRGHADNGRRDERRTKKKYIKNSVPAKVRYFCYRLDDYFSSSTAAWAAARRAIGTRNGEQEA